MSGDLIPLGYIVSTHGIKGHVKVKTFSGEGASLLPAVTLSIKKTSGEVVELKLAKSSPFKKMFIISFDGLKSIDDVLPLVKGEILIKREDMREPAGNEYYWADLMDCEVYSEGGEFLGKVAEIIETGGADVIVVGSGEKEILLPLVENVIKKVDIMKKKITVDHSGFIIQNTI